MVDIWGTRWRSWLRHCATNRKVAGSMKDGPWSVEALVDYLKSWSRNARILQQGKSQREQTEGCVCQA
jgi:CO dehydrogenase nickel-insertion accessory protein CooC1